MRDWEKNPDYPTRQGECGVCGKVGKTKQAFDRVRFICITASTCLNRWKENIRNQKELADDT